MYNYCKTDEYWNTYTNMIKIWNDFINMSSNWKNCGECNKLYALFKKNMINNLETLQQVMNNNKNFYDEYVSIVKNHQY